MNPNKTKVCLTPEERIALEFAGEGMKIGQIVEKTGYCQRKISRLLNRAYGKLGVTSRGPALVKAAQLGLIGGKA